MITEKLKGKLQYATICTNKGALLRQLAAHHEQIKSYRVISLGVFGSFITSAKVGARSDVDLLVEFDPPQGKPTITFLICPNISKHY